MKLSDALYELRHNILRDRSDIIEGQDDRLWTDETLYRYILNAQNKFARDTMMLRDSTTPEVCRFKLRTGVELYKLNDAVLSVITAHMEGDEFDLRRTGHSLMAETIPTPRHTYIDQGRPLGYSTDETEVYARAVSPTIRIYPKPIADVDGKVIEMQVARLPLGCATDTEKELEFHDDFVLNFLEYAAYLAMRTWDADAGSSTTAAEHRAAYNNAVKEAKRDLRRRVYATATVNCAANGMRWTR